MILRIIVCAKETPDTVATVEAREGVVTWDDAPLVINPWDEYAVEEALLLREKGLAATCTVISMGREDGSEALKHAIAMGADEAILISDPVLADADTLLTSHVLAQAIRQFEDVGLAVFGRQAIDGDTGQTAVQVGRRLGWSTLTYVSHILELDAAEGSITVERMLEQGRQICTGTLPAVISVLKDINEPRYPSFVGLRRATQTDVAVWTAVDIGLGAAVISKVTWPEVSNLPVHAGAAEIIDGATAEEKVEKLVEKLMAEKGIWR
ncbi:MAG: electron transfer flavoprotein subunit beta/FixA family protein [Anaerolineae bacterium]|nr:electron transfer flavoprotein subunit beta/FixA family protein [Anaerolineae bacterium]